jgi:hypothetical protein
MIIEDIQTQRPNTVAQAIVWHFSEGITDILSTGPTVYCMGDKENPFLNSGSFMCKSAFNMRGETRKMSSSDKDFIKFESLLINQYKNLSEYYKGTSLEEIKKEFSVSLSELLKFKPDVLTMELTSEKSVYYTFIKKDYSIFIQHYLDIKDPDDDVAILTAFKANTKLPSFAGNLDETLSELKDIIYPANEVKSWSPHYELSY